MQPISHHCESCPDQTKSPERHCCIRSPIASLVKRQYYTHETDPQAGKYGATYQEQRLSRDHDQMEFIETCDQENETEEAQGHIRRGNSLAECLDCNHGCHADDDADGLWLSHGVSLGSTVL